MRFFRPRHLALLAVAAVLSTGACSATSAPVISAPAAGPTLSPSAVLSPVPAPSPAPTTTLAASARDGCVQTTVASMTLRQIVGQVLLVGTPVDDPDSVKKVITKYSVGGIFLAGRSKSSAAHLRSEIAALQAAAPAGTQLFTALDQEGGEVQTLQGHDFPPIPTAVDQGKQSLPALKEQATAWARRLAAIGVNLDLAPVADTVPASLGTRNPPIGLYHRQYGSDPAQVAADIKAIVPALQDAGIMTTLKHFPGLGRTKVNTDYSTGATDSVTTASDPYLDPFIAGIAAGSGAVMISSATYPKLDSAHIAAFSAPIVTDLLRARLGFHGMIVSDSLAGAAAVSSVPTGQRALRFIEAGGDLALTTQASKAPTMINGLLTKAQSSETFRAQVTEAARYVLRAKYDAGLLGCSAQP
jgi:beta-N-acetylhexosaminidase